MKSLLLLTVIAAQLFGVACSLSQHAQTVAQRQPLEKQQHEYQSPTRYEPRISGFNPKTGDPITYDHKPRVELLDARAGKYAIRWVGFDGEEKMTTFQRADAVDVVINAAVSKTAAGHYLYTYEVMNLPSSGTQLKRFIVQTLATELQPEQGGDFMSFEMSKQIADFSEGRWYNFADVSDDVQVDPGHTVRVHLTSPSPPGLVGCRASAETIIEGTDEEMPSDLEAMLVGYNEYLRGHTIGPDERLTKLPPASALNTCLINSRSFGNSAG